MDVNRQAWTAGADLLVHPSERYVGLRAERAFVQKGEPIVIDAIATDLDGRAVAGRAVHLRAERLDWEQVEGEWKEVPKDAQERTLESTGEPVRARFEAKEGGAWRVVARVADERGRAQRDRAAGLGGRRPSAPAARPRGREGHARPRPEGVPGGRRGEGPGAGALRSRGGNPDPAPQRSRARGALRDRGRLAHARDPRRGGLHAQRARPGRPGGPGAPRGDAGGSFGEDARRDRRSRAAASTCRSRPRRARSTSP